MSLLERWWFRPVSWVLVIVFMMTFVVACSDADPDDDNERQQQIQERVRNQRPIPDVSYSQTYDTIVKWMDRWNVADKISYVYILADTGQMIGYYTSQGRPVNICTFLTKPYTWDKATSGSSWHTVPAPALDGVYYGGGGCDSWYFFTADTDAFVEIGGGMKFFVTDQPLALEVEELRVAGD